MIHVIAAIGIISLFIFPITGALPEFINVKTSFGEFKDYKSAALYVKNQTAPDEYIITDAHMYVYYYSERPFVLYENESDFIQKVEEYNISYVYDVSNQPDYITKHNLEYNTTSAKVYLIQKD